MNFGRDAESFKRAMDIAGETIMLAQLSAGERRIRKMLVGKIFEIKDISFGDYGMSHIILEEVDGNTIELVANHNFECDEDADAWVEIL